jgi:hypothetical protein
MIKRMIKAIRQKADAQLMACSLLAYRIVRPLGGGGE